MHTIILEIAANHTTIFLNFFFWERPEFAVDGVMLRWTRPTS